MKNEIKSLEEAYKKYVLDNRVDIENSIIKYIMERLKVNKTEIENIIELNKKTIKYEDILDSVQEILDYEIESYHKTIINKQGFMFSQVLVPEGIIAVEAYEPLEIIKYWIKAIKTRNAIAISSVEYDETSIEALILIIIKEALSKYNLDENLIMYIPFEECFYEYFDKIIYTYNENGEAEKKKINEEQEEKMYVYIEDEFFRQEAEQNSGAEIIEDEMNEVLKKIKGAKCASIYTQNSEKAFQFINLADCKNVFVNTSVENAIQPIQSDDELFKYKNIIIPIPKDMIAEISKERDNIEIEENRDNTESQTQLVKYKESLWEKLKRRFGFGRK